ncbi:hypothetical protein KY343_05510, partial [Candidatus Woesearchaeota archaeon]|nr:hypothetical protein [Candidatus Woesearchaeota archaeon]
MNKIIAILLALVVLSPMVFAQEAVQIRTRDPENEVHKTELRERIENFSELREENRERIQAAAENLSELRERFRERRELTKEQI